MCNPEPQAYQERAFVGGRILPRKLRAGKGCNPYSTHRHRLGHGGIQPSRIQRRTTRIYHCWDESEVRDLLPPCGLRINCWKKVALADSHLLLWAEKGNIEAEHSFHCSCDRRTIHVLAAASSSIPRKTGSGKPIFPDHAVIELAHLDVAGSSAPLLRKWLIFGETSSATAFSLSPQHFSILSFFLPTPGEFRMTAPGNPLAADLSSCFFAAINSDPLLYQGGAGVARGITALSGPLYPLFLLQFLICIVLSCTIWSSAS